MVRVNWVKIAQVLEREHVTRSGDGYICKICNAEIVPEKDTAFSRYAAIYRHFKERHPDVVERAKAQMSGGGTASTTARRVVTIDAFLTGGEEEAETTE